MAVSPVHPGCGSAPQDFTDAPSPGPDANPPDAEAADTIATARFALRRADEAPAELANLIGPRGARVALDSPAPPIPFALELLALPDLALGPLTAPPGPDGIHDPIPVLVDPIALGSSDGARLALIARPAPGAAPPELALLSPPTDEGPLLLEVDLSPPTLVGRLPADDTVAALPTITLHLADRAGLDLELSDLALALDQTPLPLLSPPTLAPLGADLQALTLTLPPLPPDTSSGRLRLQLRLADRLGNVSAPIDITYELDTRAPLLELLTPAPDTIVTDTLSVTLTAPDTVSLDLTLADTQGQSTTHRATFPAPLSAPFTHVFLADALAPLAEGPLTLLVEARDALDNLSTADLSLLYDDSAPLVVDFHPPPGTHLRPPFTLAVTAFDAAAGLATLEADGQTTPFSPDGTASLHLESVPSSFVIRDRADRATTVRPGLRLDATPPATTFHPDPTPPEDGAPRPLLTQVTLTLVDTGCRPDLAATAASLEVTLDNLPTAFTTAHSTPSLDTLALTVTLAHPSSGAWSVTARPTDRCGNAAPPVSALYFVDAEDPELSVTLHAPNAPYAKDLLHVSAAAYDQNGIRQVAFRARQPPLSPGAPEASSPPWSILTAPPYELALDLSPLPEGPLLVEVLATDRATNTTSAHVEIIHDQTPPHISGALPEWIGLSPALQLSVEDELADLAHLAIHLVSSPGGALPSPALLSALALDGRHATPTLALHLPPLPAGPVTLRAVASDIAGNTRSLDLGALLDPTPPVVVSAPADTVAEAFPPLTFALYDADSGPDPLASLVTAEHNSAPVADLPRAHTADTLTLTPALAAGRWRFTVTPRDRAGQLGPPYTAAIDIDLAPPTLTLSGASGWSSGDSAPVELEVSDDTAVTRVDLVLVDARDQAVTTTLVSPPWRTTLPLDALDDGELTLTAIATDLALRQSSTSDTLRVDNWPPTLAISPPTELVAAHFPLPCTASDDGSGLDRVEVIAESLVVGRLELDGEATSSATIPVSLPVSGLVALTVRAIDRVGRSTETTLEVEVDAEAPTVTASPPPGPRLTAPSITLTLTDAGAGPDLEATALTLQATIDDHPLPLTTTLDASANTLIVTLPDDIQGTVSLSLSPTDLLGNAAPRLRLDYPVDSRRPALTAIEPAPNASTISPLARFTLSFDEPVLPPPAGTLSLRATSTAGERFIAATATTLPSAPNALLVTPHEPLGSNELVLLEVATDTGGPHIVDLAGNPLHPPQLAASFRVETFAFIDLATELGLADYRGGTSEPGENHAPGGVFADLDGDGYPDLVLPPAPNQPLFVHLNRPSLPASPGAPPPRHPRRLVPMRVADPISVGAAGALAVDIDNDGDRDLYLVFWNAPNVLYRNLLVETGALAFVNDTASTVPTGADASPDQLGLAQARYEGQTLTLSMTAAFADVNRDGLPDLYVGNHNGHWNVPQVGTRPGQRDILYIQRPDGTFLDLTLEMNVPGWLSNEGTYVTSYQSFSSANAVIFADLDNDLWPDLVVTNKTRHPNDRDMLYRNLGLDEDGLWQGFAPINWDFNPSWGTTNPLAMGIDAADFDGDGDIDLYITDWAPFGAVPGPNELWVNQLAETGTFSLVRSTEATGMYSWGAQFQDFDNDGRLDLHVSSNFDDWDRLYMRRLRPDGSLRFEDEAQLAAVRQRQNSRGTMTADLDKDGRVDLVVINLDVSPRLYWNRYPAAANRRWLSVSLVGDPTLPGPFRSTRDALGARLLVRADVFGTGQPTLQTRPVLSGSSNGASTSSLALELGLGHATSADLEVHWPSGRVTLHPGVATNQHITLTEAAP